MARRVSGTVILICGTYPQFYESQEAGNTSEWEGLSGVKLD
jgi:hypothetical protein